MSARSQRDRRPEAAGTRLTYANVMATIAFFVAVGGGAYAAIELPRDSVGPRELKGDAVKPSDLHPRTERMLRPTGNGFHKPDTVTVPRCGETALISRRIRVKTRSRIFAYGQAEYDKVGDRPEWGALSARLLDEPGGAVLARTAEITDGYIVDEPNWIQGLNVGGVLLKPHNSGPDGPAYTAAPGRYTLSLIGGSLGNCGNDDPSMENSTLSYLALGR